MTLQPALAGAFLWSLLLALVWNPTLPSEGLDLDRPFRITGRIADAPRIERNPDQLVFELEPTHIDQNGTPPPGQFEERLTVYLSSTSGGPQQWFDPPLRFGETVRFRTRLKEPTSYRVPGVPDLRWIRWARGVYFSASLKSPLQLERLEQDSSARVVLVRPFVEYLSSFRSACRRMLSRPTGELLAAAMTGDRHGVPADEWDRLERLSLVHLLVVSGFHIGLLAWSIGLVTLRWGRPGRLVRLIALWAFALACGAATPVTRAALVVSLLETGNLLGLRNRLFNILGAAALILLIHSPRSLYSVSFQYTFLSVLAILAVAPALRILDSASRGPGDLGNPVVLVVRRPDQRYRRAIRFRLEAWCRFIPGWLVGGPLHFMGRGVGWLAAAGTVTAAIQLVLLPLFLRNTNQWTLSAVINNVVALPLFTLFFLTGFLLFLVHTTPLAVPVAPAVDLFGRLFVALLGTLESINQIVYLPPPGPALLVCCFVLLTTALLPGRIRFWAVPACPILLALVLGLRAPAASPGLIVTLLDVGQAESIHLRYPDGTDALVDTGGSHFARGSRFLGRRVLARYLLSERSRHLRFVLITHPEADHFGAFPSLSRVFPPGVVYSSTPLPSAGSEDRKEQILKRGDEFEIGGVRHVIHHPPGNPWSPEANANSIVLELRIGCCSILLTGDIDHRVERSMSRRLSPVDILKVAHHGSRSGTSTLFLEKVRPRLAVVSAGRGNLFGHPSEEVRVRLDRVTCPLYSTLLHGSLRIEADGVRWTLAHYDRETDRFVPLSEGVCNPAPSAARTTITRDGSN